LFRKHPAAAAVADTCDGRRQGLRHLRRTFTIAFQQVESDTLGRLAANARHATQCIDQADEQRGK
jgi:hypothetical protein